MCMWFLSFNLIVLISFLVHSKKNVSFYVLVTLYFQLYMTIRFVSILYFLKLYAKSKSRQANWNGGSTYFLVLA